MIFCTTILSHSVCIFNKNSHNDNSDNRHISSQNSNFIDTFNPKGNTTLTLNVPTQKKEEPVREMKNDDPERPSTQTAAVVTPKSSVTDVFNWLENFYSNTNLNNNDLSHISIRFKIKLAMYFCTNSIGFYKIFALLHHILNFFPIKVTLKCALFLYWICTNVAQNWDLVWLILF